MDPSNSPTVSDFRITDHSKVMDTLENVFKKMAKGETRTIGHNSDAMFKELDLIRKKQIQLATNHVDLESMPEDEPPSDSRAAEDGESFKRNADMFTKNERDLNNLMTELNDLIGKLKDLGDASGDTISASPETTESKPRTHKA
ncbi:1532_t:CDS:2 [Paraglomus occultum]|uniref:1532_t:CDS:1 n=1 Tax=Paraglomus occultum TaxID=144539 RepID=A0A9N8ZFL2_9GLOM|nr:1532_t:CDS:2 [Paraglomus occultum]